MAPPKTARQFRSAAEQCADAEALDTQIRTRASYHATANHVAELHGISTAQLHDHLSRTLPAGVTAITLRHLHDAGRALAESGLAIPRIVRESSPANDNARAAEGMRRAYHAVRGAGATV
jgi:hypothetical protein